MIKCYNAWERKDLLEVGYFCRKGLPKEVRYKLQREQREARHTKLI
jgi:hypothetical protein